MDTVSPRATKDKPHYTYVLKYPEDYPELDKAGTAFYVGKGTKARKGRDRIEQHEREARRGVKSYKCSVIRKIWRNGYEIEKEILTYFATHQEACMHEIALIFFLPNLTNVTMGGDGVFDPTGEMYRRISEKLKGRPSPLKGRIMGPLPEEQRRKIAAGNKGRKPTAETIRKQLETRKVSPREAEANRKRSERMQGKPMPEGSRLKMIATKTGKPGHPMSEETKRKLIEANTNREVSEETRSKMAVNSSRPAVIERLRGYNEARKMQALNKEPVPRKQKIKKKRKQSPQTIANRVAKNTGQKRTEETRRKMSVANSKKVWPGFIAPDGTRYENIVNLKDFCKEHGLTPSAMSMVNRGQASHHKGWKTLPAKDDHIPLTNDYTQGQLFP